MERQDAIYWITNLIGRYGKEYDKALEMAESALRQSKLTEDAVSRQQVIDTIMGEPSETYYPCYFAEMIRELPSAQPATNCSEIPNGSDDTISRQAAIEALARMMPRSYTPDGSHPADEEIFRAQEVFVDCIEALEILPAVQPEIIRCKDCAHWKNEHLCESLSRFGSFETKADFHCGYAERRTDE